MHYLSPGIKRMTDVTRSCYGMHLVRHRVREAGRDRYLTPPPTAYTYPSDTGAQLTVPTYLHAGHSLGPPLAVLLAAERIGDIGQHRRIITSTPRKR